MRSILTASYGSLINPRVRYFLGAASLMFAILFFHFSCSGHQTVTSTVKSTVCALLLWIVSVFMTDKYIHKYPQRYYPYALAANFKAFLLISVSLAVFFSCGLIQKYLFGDLIRIMTLFSIIDLFWSLPRVRKTDVDIRTLTDLFFAQARREIVGNVDEPVPVVKLNLTYILHRSGTSLPLWASRLAQSHVDNDPLMDTGPDEVAVIEDLYDLEKKNIKTATCSMLVCRTCLNTERRLNGLLKTAVGVLVKGGYLLVAYKPLEIELAQLKKNSTSKTFPFKYLFHFVWNRSLLKSRWLSKMGFSASLARTEILGRLVFQGMEIVSEESDGKLFHLIAKKVSEPLTKKIPTNHAVVTLEKVGLNGEIIRLHKIRSMYPFSEFLQKDLYDQHGLTNTGKFKNDFRLTDYGPFIRKYWIDEIPGIFDWLKGDVKLVGMRATSPHFLSLYPREVVELYLQVKPGLVPPIFDDKTTGFEQIVEIERTYLKSYLKKPLRTDLMYFWYTFRDIFFRKVRSK